MAKNKNLTKAKKAKNDEFYTMLSDIEKELRHYKNHFIGKTIFLNCDDPEESNFWKYFELNFEFLGLKKLISTHFHTDRQTYKLEIIGDINGDGKVNKADIIRTVLTGNGDFRSPESIEILKECDIVVTNPPFSLFREFINLLMIFEKKFLVIGNMGAVGYKDIFKDVKNNKIWLGVTKPKEFKQPDGTFKKFGNICWFTNLNNKSRSQELILYKEYNSTDYPKYLNYDAIDVDKLTNIPKDYNGVMGCPVTILENFNPKQFEIVGLGSGESLKEVCNTAIYPKDFLVDYFKSGKKGHLSAGMYGLAMYKNGVAIAPYARILIKNKQL